MPSPLSGFLLVRKPAGITSFQVVKRVRYLTKVKRVGHAGTLDPFATGLLILALGREYTRQIDSFQNLDKIYRVSMVLGMNTDTYDAYGKVLHIHKPDEPLLERMNAILPQFIGEQLQYPPAFSAKKIQGKKAYDLARKGIEVELKPHLITIHDIKILSSLQYSFQLFELEVHCSKGTYIRSLVADIGKLLSCGAYAKDLVRTAIGSYHVENALDYSKLSIDTISQKIFQTTNTKLPAK